MNTYIIRAGEDNMSCCDFWSNPQKVHLKVVCINYNFEFTYYILPGTYPALFDIDYSARLFKFGVYVSAESNTRLYTVAVPGDDLVEHCDPKIPGDQVDIRLLNGYETYTQPKIYGSPTFRTTNESCALETNNESVTNILYGLNVYNQSQLMVDNNQLCHIVGGANDFNSNKRLSVGISTDGFNWVAHDIIDAEYSTSVGWGTTPNMRVYPNLNKTVGGAAVSTINTYITDPEWLYPLPIATSNKACDEWTYRTNIITTNNYPDISSATILGFINDSIIYQVNNTSTLKTENRVYSDGGRVFEYTMGDIGEEGAVDSVYCFAYDEITNRLFAVTTLGFYQHLYVSSNMGIDWTYISDFNLEEYYSSRLFMSYANTDPSFNYTPENMVKVGNGYITLIGRLGVKETEFSSETFIPVAMQFKIPPAKTGVCFATNTSADNAKILTKTTNCSVSEILYSADPLCNTTYYETILNDSCDGRTLIYVEITPTVDISLGRCFYMFAFETWIWFCGNETNISAGTTYTTSFNSSQANRFKLTPGIVDPENNLLNIPSGEIGTVDISLHYGIAP